MCNYFQEASPFLKVLKNFEKAKYKAERSRLQAKLEGMLVNSIREKIKERKRADQQLREEKKRADQQLAEERKRADQQLAEERKRADQQLSEERKKSAKSVSWMI